MDLSNLIPAPCKFSLFTTSQSTLKIVIMTDSKPSLDIATGKTAVSSESEPAGDNFNTTAHGHLATVAKSVPKDGTALEADNGDNDSDMGSDNSDSTPMAASIWAGYVENGKWYRTKREGEYGAPNDAKQVRL